MVEADRVDWDAASLMACHDCGAVHRIEPMSPGQGAFCRQCEGVLATAHHRTLERSLALHVAAAVLFVLAHILPFMTFELEGRALTSHLWQGAIALTNAGMWPLGGLVLLLATIIPGVKILLGLGVLQAVCRGKTSRGVALAFRWLERLKPWSMMEVFLLGVIVAFVKLSDLATIGLGPGLWCFGLLIPLLAAADFILDPREVWEDLQPQAQAGSFDNRPFIACHGCRQLVDDRETTCPRCFDTLHLRKANSLQATWALLIAASILYAPANMLPIMTVISFGQGEPDTIISGVFLLVEAGMLPVALLVLVASIVVPVLKLAGLTFLLVSVQFRSTINRRHRTKLYRLIELVGRWSMVDVFMIAILTSLVNLGQIATIEPGIGALCFAGVVILTMLASMSFDPRLIWDEAQPQSNLGEGARV